MEYPVAAPSGAGDMHANGLVIMPTATNDLQPGKSCRMKSVYPECGYLPVREQFGSESLNRCRAVVRHRGIQGGIHRGIHRSSAVAAACAVAAVCRCHRLALRMAAADRHQA